MDRVRFGRAGFWILVFMGTALSTAFAGKRAPKIAETIDLPPTFDVDFQFAAKQRVDLGPQKEVSDDVSGQVGKEVFQSLVTTQMISGFGLPYTWTFRLADSSVVNAFSLADGEVVAFTGLSRLIGTNRGLWAAVLAHEIGHVARRHAVRKYLFHEYVEEQVRYWQIRARLGDKSAAWAAIAARVAGNLAEKKLSRDLEHDADVQGMLLMARAGYHPDYVFAMHHLLRIGGQERSRIGTFLFSEHPRWDSRDQRTERAYTGALAEYSRLWVSPDTSPGGTPPAVAFVGDVRGVENRASGSGDLTLALSCRNVERPVALVIHLTKGNGSPVQSVSGEYRDSAGNVAIHERASCLDKDSAKPTIVHIPTAILSDQDRKLKAQVEVIGPDDGILERSKVFDVHFPKADKKGSTILAKVRVEPELIELPGGQKVDQSEIASAVSPVPLRTEAPSETAPVVAADLAQPHASVPAAATRTEDDHRGGVVPTPVAVPPELATRNRPYNTTVSQALGVVPSALDSRGLPSYWANTVVADSSVTWWKISPLTESARKVSYSRSVLYFPVQRVDTESLPTSITITNTSSAAMTGLSLRIGGSDPSDFVETNNCGGIVEAGAMCTLLLKFVPTANGTRTGVLTIDGTLEQVALSGIGK